MNWSYGVTTCASRLRTLLPETLESLAAAGFPSPRLFVDGAESGAPPGYDVTYRYPVVRTAGNWVLSAWELLFRDPWADYYAIFQDDAVFSKGLREYLEASLPHQPLEAYFNLYTFPKNEGPDGWHPSPNTNGLGAVALVFGGEAFRTLLGSKHISYRPMDKSRGHRLIDAGIVWAMHLEGFKEYTHTPSLCQHTGLKSSMGNGKMPLSESWRGVDWVPTFTPPKDSPARIGLVGYSCDTGLGTLNSQIAAYCDIDTWLVVPHARLPTVQRSDKCVEADVHKWLDDVDVVVFCETEYIRGLAELCKRRGVRTACVPMHEWMPPGAKGWPQSVDLFLCPTHYCYEQFRNNVKCVEWPCPIDTEHFTFRQRFSVDRFGYSGGLGGFRGRKGRDVIDAALKIWPDMPIDVFDQRTNYVKDARQLYEAADVMIVPHKCDGVALTCLEAAASGALVVATDGRPWDEYPRLAKIRAEKSRAVIKRPVDWWEPDPRALVETCQKLMYNDVARFSARAREWAEQRSWTIKGPELTALLRSIKGPAIGGTTQMKRKRGRYCWDLVLPRLGPGKTVVEIGTIRDPRPIAREADGHSTVRWAETGAQVVTVDVNENALMVVQKMVPSVTAHKCDGVKFLRLYQGPPIDLLYLDGPDPDAQGQAFCLRALQAAMPHLAPNACVLVDDCDLENGGKGALLKASDFGFRQVFKDRHMLWDRA